MKRHRRLHGASKLGPWRAQWTALGSPAGPPPLTGASPASPRSLMNNAGLVDYNGWARLVGNLRHSRPVRLAVRRVLVELELEPAAAKPIVESTPQLG